MKKFYKFDYLIKSEIPSQFHGCDLFFKMRELTSTGKLDSVFESVDSLIDGLTYNCYYVAHNLVQFRGKKTTFPGEIFMANKSDLISFIRFSVESDDLRSMLLSPCFDSEPDQVILVTEDASCLYLPSVKRT